MAATSFNFSSGVIVRARALTCSTISCDDDGGDDGGGGGGGGGVSCQSHSAGQAAHMFPFHAGVAPSSTPPPVQRCENPLIASVEGLYSATLKPVQHKRHEVLASCIQTSVLFCGRAHLSLSSGRHAPPALVTPASR